MNKPDRLTIDLRGLRGRIEAFRADPAWKELSINGKIRVLLETALGSSPEPNSTQSISELVQVNWEAIVESQIDLSLKRLSAIRDGARPSDDELVQLSAILLQDVHQLIDIRKRIFGNGNGEKTNGETAKSL